VARHSTALGERRYRCYLPVLAEFTRLPMHGTWPGIKVLSSDSSATGFLSHALEHRRTWAKAFRSGELSVPRALEIARLRV